MLQRSNPIKVRILWNYYTVYATSFRGWSKRSEPTRSAFYSWASGSERRASQGRHDFSARESHRENINKKTIRPTLLILSSLSVIKTTSFDTLVTPAVGPFNTQILGGGAKQRIERGSPSCMYKTTYTPPDGCRKLFRLNDAEIPLVKDFVFSSPWPSPFYYIGSEDVRKEEKEKKLPKVPFQINLTRYRWMEKMKKKGDCYNNKTTQGASHGTPVNVQRQLEPATLSRRLLPLGGNI